MIPRYTSKEMGSIWTEENEDRTMMRVEILACEAMNKLGIIPDEDLKNIQTKSDFDLDRVHEIEKVTNHDIISLLTAIGEHVGESSKYIHKGLTSSDVKDTAMGVMMKQSAELLLKLEKELREVLRKQAVKYRNTICVGRTHGIHAEPTIFGLKFLLWMDETDRNIERLELAKKYISIGKLSGAVGTYSNINPFVEDYVCKKLGLEAAKLATQVIQRDRHAFYLTTIAVCGASLEKMALEIRHLQRTEVREAEEYFAPGQKGSSAMPHKRNPITCEKICGLARVLRGNAEAALENVALWHERDISHSSVERIILPDPTILLDHMLRKTTSVLDKLLVYPDAMIADLNKTGGLIYSPNVLTALVTKGAARNDAYVWVQRNAMARWLKGEDFKANLEKDEDIKKYLTDEDIEACMEPKHMLKNVDMIYARFGL